VIAKALREGKPSHRAALVIKADSRISSVRDLKGKTVAFVSPKSATGHIAPLATLNDAGVTADGLAHYQFLGSHDEVARAVLNGDFDAGGLSEETALAYREKGLKVLQLSPEVPEFNLCCNTSVDEKTMTAIRDALIALDVTKAADAQVLQSLGKDCTGFMAASESDYDTFREKIMSVEAAMSADGHLHGMRSFRSSR
jgi:phosphonate transport system substrate-binding protein